MAANSQPGSPNSPAGQEHEGKRRLAAQLIGGVQCLALWLSALILTDTIDSKLFVLDHGLYEAIFGLLVVAFLLAAIAFFRSPTGQRVEGWLLRFRLPSLLEVGYRRLDWLRTGERWSTIIRWTLVVMVPALTLAAMAKSWAAATYGTFFAEFFVFMLVLFPALLGMLVLLSLIAGLWPKRPDDAA